MRTPENIVGNYCTVRFATVRLCRDTFSPRFLQYLLSFTQPTMLISTYFVTIIFSKMYNTA